MAALASCLFFLVLSAPPPAGSEAETERKTFLNQLEKDLKDNTRALEEARQPLRDPATARPEDFLHCAEVLVRRDKLMFYQATELQRDQGVGARAMPEGRKQLLREAFGLYRQVINRFPTRPENDQTLLDLADVHRWMGDYEKVLATLQELLEHHPKGRAAAEARVRLGDYHFDREQMELAEAHYLEALALPSCRATQVARYKLAWVYINRSRDEDHKKLFRQALTQLETLVRTTEPQPAITGYLEVDLRQEALMTIPFVYSEVGDPERALPYFDSFPLPAQWKLQALLRLANRYFIKEKFTAALSIYRKVDLHLVDVDERADVAERIRELEELIRPKH